MLLSPRLASWYADFHGPWAYIKEAILEGCWCLRDWYHNVYAPYGRWTPSVWLIGLPCWKIQETTTSSLIIQLPISLISSCKEHLPTPHQVQHYNALHSRWSTPTSVDNTPKQDTHSDDTSRQDWKYGNRTQFPLENRDDDFHVKCIAGSRLFRERRVLRVQESVVESESKDWEVAQQIRVKKDA